MTDERSLIRRARQGDQEAFGQLIALHQRMVFGLALSQTRSRQDAEEIAQIVFMKAWKGLASFREEASLSTWLYRLTRNACVDFHRQNRKRRGDRSLEEPGMEVLRDPAPLPQEILEGKERQQALLTAIDTLPEHHRSVLILRELEGLDYETIARRLDLQVGTVRSRLSRARRALRDALLASGNFDDLPPSKEKRGGMAP